MFILGVFLIERLCGLFVVVFLWLILRLIDEMVCRVCFEGLFFGLFFLIVWFDWLFRLVVFYWTVVILCERRKIKVWRCIATLLLLNPVSKWVRSDSNGWSFDLDVYCLLWKRFCVLNVALRMTKKLNRLRNSDGYVLVLKKTQRVVRPCFNCVDFMAQTLAA